MITWPQKGKIAAKLRIDIMLVLSEWANAREYYSEKTAAVKKREDDTGVN